MSEERYKLSDLFGYVRLGPDGNVIERCSDPPSRWRPEILEEMRAMRAEVNALYSQRLDPLNFS